MSSWIQDVVQSLGYFGIALLMFLENVFPPLPSEIIMPAAGFAAAENELTLLGVILAGWVGSTVGQLPLFCLGRWVSVERLQGWADRRGRWLGVSSRELRRGDAWFNRHGDKAVLFCRLIPGLRSVISIPAGMSGMNLWRFLIYTSIGAFAWTALLACLGWWLGDNFELVSQYVQPISITITVIVVAVAVWWWFRQYHHHERQAA
ncbi:MAG: DedA family protein [Planctomycetales bacterium]|nr:DedA family protein [Planctomycetales bacterium]